MFTFGTICADGYDPASPPLPGSEIYILLQDSVTWRCGQNLGPTKS